MTTEARGYLVMAVREARWSIRELRAGNTYGALNRLCYAWRFLGNAERGMERPSQETEGTRRSYERAERAVNVAQMAFVEAWPSRYAGIRTALYAPV